MSGNTGYNHVFVKCLRNFLKLSTIQEKWITIPMSWVLVQKKYCSVLNLNSFEIGIGELEEKYFNFNQKNIFFLWILKIIGIYQFCDFVCKHVLYRRTCSRLVYSVLCAEQWNSAYKRDERFSQNFLTLRITEKETNLIMRKRHSIKKET